MPTHFIVNPTTGERKMLLNGEWVPATSQASGAAPGSAKLTEDQGKSQGYARLMQDAEGNYRRAVQEGYNPGDFRNSSASVVEGLPFGGLDGLGTLIRDQVGDRARQAELQWSDAQLKAMSGAASPEPEVKRNVQTFFARPGENFSDIDPQKRKSRQTAYESAKVRAGPVGESLGDYIPKPQRDPNWRAQMPAAQMKAAKMFTGSKAAPGSQQNPFTPTSPDEFRNIPKGSFVIDDDGTIFRKAN
jgi:hypothetical protein